MPYKLTDEQQGVCRKAVEHFGRRAQLLKVAEELIELSQECIQAANAAGNAGALAHERADVEIVLYQFDNLLLPSLRQAVRAKIASQIERLEGRLDNGE